MFLHESSKSIQDLKKKKVKNNSRIWNKIYFSFSRYKAEVK